MPCVEPVDRFVLAVEQLQLCRELLLDGSPAKARMAVILLDGLADALLYRRLERLYRHSDEDFLGETRYPKALRRQARNDFGTRLRLCADSTHDAFITGGVGPLVTADAAVVLGVGHSYRNAAYHRDRHNPATIGAVGRLFFDAVAGLFVRSHWLGHTSSVTAAQAERLQALRVPLHGGGAITWPEAAAAVTRELGEGLPVPHDELVELLVSDLEERADAVEELGKEADAEPEDLDGLMASLEFQDVHGADDELLELRDQRDPARRAVIEHVEITADLIEDARRADVRYQERLTELGRNWEPRAAMGTIARARAVAEDLAEERGTRRVLTTYQQIDGELDLLEEYLGRALAEIDRAVSAQMDMMSGR